MHQSRLPNVVPLRSDLRSMSCADCEARQTCLTAGMDDADCARVSRLVLQRHRLLRGHALYQMNEPVRGRLYAIRSGQFKCFQLTPAGDQRITGLPSRGALLGLDAIGTEVHTSAATATTESVLCELSHPRLIEAGRDFPALARRMERMLSKELARQQGLALHLSRQTAEQKIAHFLLELAWPDSTASVTMPLTRRDTGDYLGLTDATVTRQLLRLHRQCVLRVDRKHVRLVNRRRLEELAAGNPPAQLSMDKLA